MNPLLKVKCGNACVWLCGCLAGILVKEGDKDCAPTRCVRPPANYTNIFCVQLGSVTLCIHQGLQAISLQEIRINQQGIKAGNLIISYYWIVVFIFRKGKSFYAISIESFSNHFINPDVIKEENFLILPGFGLKTWFLDFWLGKLYRHLYNSHYVASIWIFHIDWFSKKIDEGLGRWSKKIKK